MHDLTTDYELLATKHRMAWALATDQVLDLERREADLCDAVASLLAIVEGQSLTPGEAEVARAAAALIAI